MYYVGTGIYFRINRSDAYGTFMGTEEVDAPLDNWHYAAGVADVTAPSCNLYVDGGAGSEVTSSTGSYTNYDHGAAIGRLFNKNANHFKGLIDETRVSDVVRSAAWIKGTYNTLWDTLLTYSAEETQTTTNVVFFGCNF